MPKTHGLSKRPEYSVWKAMMRRCYNPNATNFKHYGGRGIRVSGPWHSFSKFFEAVGPRPSPKHTIERKDNDLGYRPGNVRWATMAEQNSNRRPRRTLTFNGRTLSVTAWAKELGVSTSSICRRVDRGLNPRQVLYDPFQQRERIIMVDDIGMTLKNHAKRLGVSYKGVWARLKRGWTATLALKTPMGNGKRLLVTLVPR